MGTKEKQNKENLEDNVAVYITYNGVPLFRLPYNPNDDNYIITSSFLHIIDIFAKQTRKDIGKSAEFFGFALSNKIQVEIMEVYEDSSDKENKIILFLETPYGKSPINRNPIMALFGVSREIITKIINKELNPIFQDDMTNFFREKLEERGYTPNKVIGELKHLTISRIQSLKNMPITLFSIEKKESPNKDYLVKEVGKYNDGRYKKNPVRNKAGKLTFDPELIIGLAEALRSYQSSINIKTGSIILRFRDFSLAFSYKNDGLPVISVLLRGNGRAIEMSRYREDLKTLDLEITD